MKTKFIIGAIVALCVALFALLSRCTQEVSLILLGGQIYTGDEKQPIAQALAINGGNIVGVGTSEEILDEFSSGHLVELEGKPVFAGFIDAHGHMENLGSFIRNLDLKGTASIQSIQEKVRAKIGTIDSSEWVRGRGWDQNLWHDKVFPTKDHLDAVSGGTPVYLERVDGHVVWVNSKVMEMADINAETKDPEGGRILRNRSGEPTGIFIDNAITLLDSRLPAPTRAERTKAIVAALKTCVSMGLTGVHDMGVDLETISIFKDLIDSGEFPLRVYAAVSSYQDGWSHYAKSGPEKDYGNGLLNVRAVKVYADGALGSRGAALIGPYSDDPTNRGLTLTSEKALRGIVDTALQKGFQVCTHAIGDRANHITLNIYEDAFKSLHINGSDVRFRVEHAQIVAEEDIPRFGRIGVIPSMQPTHCTSDMYWAEERVGSVRIKGAYAWRSLLNQGSMISSGSDFPVESPNPLWGFYAAITRQDHKRWPVGGWMPSQRMSRDEALKSFTAWGAHAAFQENVKGTIEVGKYADVVVLSKDIMTIQVEEILTTEVVMTILGGKVVYSRDKGQQAQ